MAALSPQSEAAQIANAEAALTGSKPVEKSVLALAGPRARREGKALELVLDGGKTVRLTDDGKCAPEDCAHHRLAAFLPSRGVFVVWKEYTEAYDFLLVETATGKQHAIDGPPHYSPDGTRFVTCRVDEMNGGGTTVWRAASGKYVQEFQDQRMSVCGRWRDNAAFEVGVYDDVPSGKPSAFLLVRNSQGWQLHQSAGVLKARP